MGGGIDVRRIVGGGDLLSGIEPVAIVHGYMPERSQASSFAARLYGEPGIGVGHRGVGRITARLAAEIGAIALTGCPNRRRRGDNSVNRWRADGTIRILLGANVICALWKL